MFYQKPKVILYAVADVELKFYQRINKHKFIFDWSFAIDVKIVLYSCYDRYDVNLII